jgi:hypothetical protein
LISKKEIMKNIVYAFVVIGLLFSSCKKEETTSEVATSETETVATDEATSTDSIVAPVASTTAPVPTNSNGNSVMYNGQTNSAGSTVVTPTSYTTTTAAPVATAKGMNPAHGQPGHRCDIAVGAPLNSPPGKAPNPVTTQKPPQPITTSTTITPEMMSKTNSAPAAVPSTIAAPTAPGMNPPHGQEGHVCSVAVGAPLPKKE